MPNDDSPENLLEALQQGAVPHGAEASRSMGEESLDVIEALRGGSAEVAAPDATLGGYMKLHTRPAAFEGSDAQPYTVDLDTEETGRSGQDFAAFFVFLRWAETGAGIMTHLLSEDVAYGATEAEARSAALELSLYEVKAELDAAIARNRAEMEE
jgi:hypothetical protein